MFALQLFDKLLKLAPAFRSVKRHIKKGTRFIRRRIIITHVFI